MSCGAGGICSRSQCTLCNSALIPACPILIFYTYGFLILAFSDVLNAGSYCNNLQFFCSCFIQSTSSAFPKFYTYCTEQPSSPWLAPQVIPAFPCDPIFVHPPQCVLGLLGVSFQLITSIIFFISPPQKSQQTQNSV